MKRSASTSLPLIALSALLIAAPPPVGATGAKPSAWVYRSPTGNLLYGADTNGVRILDFSDCGYQRGLVALPNVSNLVEQSRWVMLQPLGNGVDDGPAINAALANVGSQTINSNGFRGVVYLRAGEYTVDRSHPILLAQSGVVLKGAGSSSSQGSRLTTHGGPMTLIRIRGSGDRIWAPGVSATFTETLVPAGTRTLRVNSVQGFQVGDSVIVTHPTVTDWLETMEMNCSCMFDPWGEGSYECHFERIITRLEGNWMTVDTPLPQTFEGRYGYGHVEPFTWPDRLQNCGVEDLYCHTSDSTEEESIPNSAVRLLAATDCWVRNVVADGWFSSAVSVTQASKGVTVAECENLTSDDSDIHFRYSFYLEKSHDFLDEPQYVLMRDCYSSHSRHSFVTGSEVPGPFAFVRCDAKDSEDESGPHERWATGGLFDNVRELGGQLISIAGHEIGAENRGNSGGGSSSQGWTGANMVMWNCYAEDGFRVRNPPTARNWLVGSNGEKKASRRGCSIFKSDHGNCWAVGPDPDGTYDQSGEDSPPVQLGSLYYAQLQQKLKWPRSGFREYRLGDIDQFSFSDADDASIPVDPAWLSEVQSSSQGHVATAHFDDARVGQAVALTFTVPGYPGEEIVAASLTLGLREAVGPVAEFFYVNTMDSPVAFSLLGWEVGRETTSVCTVEVPVYALRSGRLNIALDAGCGVDFAFLNLQVAPVLGTTAQVRTPVDTYVRDGSYESQNFAAEPELDVKSDKDSGYSRRAFLDWNLVEANGLLVDAKVRLYCTSMGQSGNEQTASVVPAHNWSPNSVTWKTQPAFSPPIAYWVPVGVGSFVEFSVTPEVRAALGGNKAFALCVQAARDFGAGGNVSYASREDPIFDHRPQLILRFGNSPPLLTVPGPQTMAANSTLGPLPVTVSDPESSPFQLALTATSSAPSVIANTDIVLAGTGANRTVTIRVPPGRVGTARITLTVTDGSLSTDASFIVNVNYVNSPPSVSPVSDQVMEEDTTLDLPFFIADRENTPANLAVRVSSSDRVLFPAHSIETVPPDAAGRCHAIFKPAPDLSGKTTITIMVHDGFMFTNRTFALTVRPVPDPPQFVRITQPTAGSQWLPGAPVLLSAEAFDVEDNLSRIRFFAQGAGGPPTLVGEATQAPYSVKWTTKAAGPYVIEAIAYDQTGLSTTSAPVVIHVSTPIPYQPQVFIAYQSNTVAVFWSMIAPSNALQTTTSLAPPITWSRLAAAPVASEGAWSYVFHASDPRRFFRLSQ